MSKFCEKCGNELDVESVFCEKCGCKVKNSENTHSTPQTEKTEVATLTDEELQKLVESKKEKFKVKDLIPMTVAILVIVTGIIVFLIFRNSGTIYERNEDGDLVFNFTAEEYLEKYNEANSKYIPEKLSISDFIKGKNDSDFDYYYHSVNNDESIVLFMDGEGYASNVETIKYNCQAETKYETPDGVIYEIRSIYPELSYDDAKNLADEARKNAYNLINNYATYKQLKVDFEFEEESGYQRWFLDPNDGGVSV